MSEEIPEENRLDEGNFTKFAEVLKGNGLGRFARLATLVLGLTAADKVEAGGLADRFPAGEPSGQVEVFTPKDHTKLEGVFNMSESNDQADSAERDDKGNLDDNGIATPRGSRTGNIIHFPKGNINSVNQMKQEPISNATEGGLELDGKRIIRPNNLN